MRLRDLQDLFEGVYRAYLLQKVLPVTSGSFAGRAARDSYVSSFLLLRLTKNIQSDSRHGELGVLSAKWKM